MHAANEIPNQCAALPRHCQSSQQQKQLPTALTVDRQRSFELFVDRTNAGAVGCDCGCKSGKTALFKPVWCVRSHNLQLQAGVQTLHTLHELREVCVVGNADGCIAAERLQEFRHTQQL